MSNVQIVISLIGFYILLMIFFWLIVSFIVWDLNPANWEQAVRFFLVLFGNGFGIAGAMYLTIEIDKWF